MRTCWHDQGTNGNNSATYINAAHRNGRPTQLDVETLNSSGTEIDTVPFTIAVLC